MTVKELIKALSQYPKNAEVVLSRRECEDCEDYDEFYDSDFYLEINDDNQLVID